MSRRIEIFDTTLRDGNKLPFITMTVADRLEMARQLARLGVDVIDAGYPAASPEEREAVERIGAEVEGPYIAVLCRTIESDVAEALNLMQAARRPYLHLFMPASEPSLRTVFGRGHEQILQEVSRLVAMVVTTPIGGAPPRVQFSLSEVGEAAPGFLLEAMRAAAEAGAAVLNVADTNGTLLPAEGAERVRAIRGALGEHGGVSVGVHFHNDLGLATACTLAAVEAGADHLEVTVSGIGGRAGNAPLEEVAFGLEVLSRRLALRHSIHLDQIHPTARLLGRITGLKPHPNKPIIGRCTLPEDRETLSRRALPEWKGRLMRAETAGRLPDAVPARVPAQPAGVRRQMEALGIPLDGVDMENACRLYNERCRDRTEVTLSEMESIAQLSRRETKVTYRLHSFSVMTGSHVHPVGVVEIECGGAQGAPGARAVHAAPGNGPMHALCRAVDRAVGFSPRIVLYSVDTLKEGMDALAEVTMTISLKGRRFQGRQVSTDVIEAGLRAYLEAMNRLADSGVQDAPEPFYVEGEHLWE